jgi:hypothetical protein
MSWRLFAVKRALAFGIALAVSIHAISAKEFILKCRTLNSNGTHQLTIDLDNRWLAFGKKRRRHGKLVVRYTKSKRNRHHGNFNESAHRSR